MNDKEVPQISVDSCVNDILDENNPKWNDWETSSIGSSEDLVNDPNDSHDINVKSNEKTANLGWNLPTNDVTKAGTLDTLSVDSYWVGEEEIEEIEKEKQNDPINPNYKSVYNKIQAKIISNENKTGQHVENGENIQSNTKK
jgi:hypothetical protein